MSLTLAAALLAAAPDFSACRIGHPGAGPKLPAECATITVAENPEQPEARQIELAVARLKSLGGEGDAAPLVFIAGGPGQSALETFPSAAAAFEDIRRERDILLVDQRGTGGSNPLRCAFPEEIGEYEFDAALVRDAARRCVTELGADLRWYTTLDAVRDLETVRARLGYEQLALYGVSYGSRVAQEYLRQYPQRVDAVILDGVVVPGEALGPEIARDAQRALELMFERCAKSTECSQAHPRLRERFAALRTRLEAQPLTVELRDPFSGERTEATITWTRATMLLRLYSYMPESVALLPLLITQADAGDWQGFAGSLLALEREAESMLYTGMHNSVVCSEDAPRFAASATEETAYLGTLTVDALNAICDVWPSRDVPAAFHEPVTADVPVLLLSGEADPVTPPENAAEVARHLPNALHVVAPGQGHGVFGRGCVPRLMSEFLRNRKPDELDAGCVDVLDAAPFFIDRNGPTP